MILLTNKSFGYMCFHPSILPYCGGGFVCRRDSRDYVVGGAFAHWWGHGKLVLSEGPDKE